MIKKITFLFFSFLFGACSSNYSPKPMSYFYIDIEDHSYYPFSDYPQFEFDISTQAEVREIPLHIPSKSVDKQKETYIAGEKWFNIIYPSLNAQIYCSYIPVTKNNLTKISEESRKFAYLHIAKASAVQEQMFENAGKKVYGLVYEIKGNVASPLQFVVTDSVKSFFRGALYFDNIPNRDSIAPVLEYIYEDIRVLINNFRWKI
ncbi:MAG: gliding motility protein GldD [Dysgonamonadaceae bacterium]|jgi:gliding motility-associated lipoprotein GldD|nr:gliding motility protein GldD [Dysgonamonadaceae bacterium]